MPGVSACHRLLLVPKPPAIIVDGGPLLDAFCGRKRAGRLTSAGRVSRERSFGRRDGGPCYARVSTADQEVAGQSMRLTQAGAIKVFTDVRSGQSVDRPGLDALLAYAREGDTLAVVRLDRLGRSLGELENCAGWLVAAQPGSSG